MSERLAFEEPSDEEVAAIVAVLFDQQSELIESRPTRPAWAVAALIEGTERWEQPDRLSRLRDMRFD